MPKFVADSSVSPTGLKWAVDPVADVVTTAGDLLYATAADTVTRLGIGTASQVLAVNSGATAPEWVTPSSGALTLISTTTLSASGSFNLSSIFSSTYKNYLILGSGLKGSEANYIEFGLRTGSTNSTANYARLNYRYTYAGAQQNSQSATGNHMSSFDMTDQDSTAANFNVFLDSPFLAQATGFTNETAYSHSAMTSIGQHQVATSYDSMWFTVNTGTVSGTISVYGYGV